MAEPRNIAAPNLPLAPKDYDRKWHEQFTNTLRLYFAAVSNAVNEANKSPKNVVELTDGIYAGDLPVPAGRVAIYVDQLDGDLKIKFSDGTVKTIITD